MKKIKVEPCGCELGFDDGSWFVLTSQGTVSLEEEVSMMGLLPLLERPYSVIIDLVRQQLLNCDLPISVVRTFPDRELVLFALENASAYWKELALNWVEDMEPFEETIGPLTRIIEASGWPQELRHRALRMRASLRCNPQKLDQA